MKTPILEVYFYETEQGNEPVRQWLQLQSPVDKQRIGEDIELAIGDELDQRQRAAQRRGAHRDRAR